MALLDIVMHYDCNLACQFCTITPEMRKRSLSTAEIQMALKRGIADGYRALSLTGGEPTIRQDLLPLIRFARSLGYKSIKVQTNGLRLGYPEYRKHFIEAGVTSIHISPHSMDPSNYSVTTQSSEEGFHLLNEAIAGLVDCGVSLTLDVLIRQDTMDGLPDWVDGYAKMGVQNFDLWFVSLTDGNADNLQSMPQLSEALPFIHEALSLGVQKGLNLRSLHVPRCLIPEFGGQIYHPGLGEDVRVLSPDATFQLKDSVISGGHKAEDCKGCPFESKCSGLRPDYVARFGDGEIREARKCLPAQ